MNEFHVLCLPREPVTANKIKLYLPRLSLLRKDAINIFKPLIAKPNLTILTSLAKIILEYSASCVYTKIVIRGLKMIHFHCIHGFIKPFSQIPHLYWVVQRFHPQASLSTGLYPPNFSANFHPQIQSNYGILSWTKRLARF